MTATSDPLDASSDFLPDFQPIGAARLEVKSEMTAAELLASDVEAPESLPVLGEPGIIYRGASHILAAFPKTGKTTWLLATVVPWLHLGLDVLWITEESRPVWRTRLEAVPAAAWDRLHLHFGHGFTPDQLLARATSGHEQIVIVDTLRNLLAIADENDNSEVARRINPWIGQVRNADKTLILVHHVRKGGGEHGEGVTGAHALIGAVDVVMQLMREDNASEQRQLKTLSRFGDGQSLIYERQPDGAILSMGSAGQVARRNVENRILAILQEPMTTKAVHEALGAPRPSQETVRQALVSLASADKIDRDPPLSFRTVQGMRVRWTPKLNLQPTTSLQVGSEVMPMDEALAVVRRTFSQHYTEAAEGSTDPQPSLIDDDLPF